MGDVGAVGAYTLVARFPDCAGIEVVAHHPLCDAIRGAHPGHRISFTDLATLREIATVLGDPAFAFAVVAGLIYGAHVLGIGAGLSVLLGVDLRLAKTILRIADGAVTIVGNR